MTPKLSDHQLSQLLGSVTGNKKFKANNTTSDSLLESLFVDCDNFQAPFYISDTFVCKERFPIYQEILNPKHSGFVDLLKDNLNQVCLVSDSVMKGVDGLFFIVLTDDKSRITEWFSFLQIVV